MKCIGMPSPFVHRPCDPFMFSRRSSPPVTVWSTPNAGCILCANGTPGGLSDWMRDPATMTAIDGTELQSSASPHVVCRTGTGSNPLWLTGFGASYGNGDHPSFPSDAVVNQVKLSVLRVRAGTATAGTNIWQQRINGSAFGSSQNIAVDWSTSDETVVITFTPVGLTLADITNVLSGFSLAIGASGSMGASSDFTIKGVTSEVQCTFTPA